MFVYIGDNRFRIAGLQILDFRVSVAKRLFFDEMVGLVFQRVDEVHDLPMPFVQMSALMLSIFWELGSNTISNNSVY